VAGCQSQGARAEQSHPRGGRGAKHELYTIFRQAVKQGIPIILISDELLELIGLSNRIMIMRDRKVSSEVPAPADGKPTEAQLVKHMV